jgi:hypothetical protein
MVRGDVAFFVESKLLNPTQLIVSNQTIDQNRVIAFSYLLHLSLDRFEDIQKELDLKKVEINQLKIEKDKKVDDTIERMMDDSEVEDKLNKRARDYFAPPSYTSLIIGIISAVMGFLISYNFFRGN